MEVAQLGRPAQRLTARVGPKAFAQPALCTYVLFRVPIERPFWPAQVAVPKVALGTHARCGAEHAARERAEGTFHEREVLDLIVGREEQRASPKLSEDAPHRPLIDRMVPLQAEGYLGRTVLPRAHDGRVVLVLPRGSAKVDERHARMRGQSIPPVERRDEQNVLGLEVGVGETNRVYVLEGLEAVGSDRGNLREREVAADARAHY